MNSLQFGSLSPTLSFRAYPSEIEIVSSYDQAVNRPAIEAHLPLYDEQDGNELDRLSRAVQRSVERYTGIDATKRTRVAFWQQPQPVINIPTRPVHQVLSVEQKINNQWVAINHYETEGLKQVSIRLQFSRPTRVMYESGYDTVPDELAQAILQEIAYQYKNRNDPNESPANLINGISEPTRNTLATLI